MAVICIKAASDIPCISTISIALWFVDMHFGQLK